LKQLAPVHPSHFLHDLFELGDHGALGFIVDLVELDVLAEVVLVESLHDVATDELLYFDRSEYFEDLDGNHFLQALLEVFDDRLVLVVEHEVAVEQHLSLPFLVKHFPLSAVQHEVVLLILHGLLLVEIAGLEFSLGHVSYLEQVVVGLHVDQFEILEFHFEVDELTEHHHVELSVNQDLVHNRLADQLPHELSKLELLGVRLQNHFVVVGFFKQNVQRLLYGQIQELFEQTPCISPQLLVAERVLEDNAECGADVEISESLLARIQNVVAVY